MPGSITVFLALPVRDLEVLLESFKEEFDTLLKDLFSDEELELYEGKLEAISAVSVSPVSSDITFDDFYAGPEEEAKKDFFERCKSIVCFENLPFLESNPFQVSYLQEFMGKLSEGLIDRGGIYELMSLDEFLLDLKKFRNMDFLIPELPKEEKPLPKTSFPVDPIDFLVIDVYKELDRLRNKGLFPEDVDLSPKVRKIYAIAREGILDAKSFFTKSGLNAKDFDDGLEHLKFWLRKH